MNFYSHLVTHVEVDNERPLIDTKWFQDSFKLVNWWLKWILAPGSHDKESLVSCPPMGNTWSYNVEVVRYSVQQHNNHICVSCLFDVEGFGAEDCWFLAQAGGDRVQQLEMRTTTTVSVFVGLA